MGGGGGGGVRFSKMLAGAELRAQTATQNRKTLVQTRTLNGPKPTSVQQASLRPSPFGVSGLGFREPAGFQKP